MSLWSRLTNNSNNNNHNINTNHNNNNTNNNNTNNSNNDKSYVVLSIMITGTAIDKASHGELSLLRLLA